MSKKKGVSLVYVIIVMVLATIFATSISVLTRANTMQAKVQKDNIDAHYLARSGIEIMYENLKTNNLMKGFVNSNTISGGSFSYRFPDIPQSVVDVKATAVQVVGSDNKIVTITSKAKLNGISEDEKLELRFELVVKNDAGKKVIDTIRDFKWSR
ncbi:hypothetical protein [Peptoanaerobacter stomatis]|uniref:hypothetical protein n=1 Tax=Peptoanaerobacter stomatis TaxID=796937 RepID=UPI003F9EE06C